jgi:hypothetical protein
MAGNNDSNDFEVETDEPIMLRDLVALAKRHPPEARSGRDYGNSDWAIVAEDDEVLHYAESDRMILDAFFSLLSGDAATALRLRVVRVTPNSEVEVQWPSSRSELERAAVGPLSGDESVIRRWLQRHFLCGRFGEITVGVESRQVIELSWFDAAGHPFVIGWWHRPFDDSHWELLAGRWPAARADITVSRIAETLNDAIDGEVTVARVKSVRREMHRRNPHPELLDELIKLSVLTAESIGALDISGGDME